MVSIHKKTGFKCFDFEVCILDNNGNIFYHKKNINFPKPILFNLPKGVYKPLNTILALNKPVFYELPKLYQREKKSPLKRIKIHFVENNNNKASIDVNTGNIFIDEKYKKNKTILTFLFWHEIGHFFYFSENKCDVFAANKMLKKGFNPSQVSLAALTGLNCNIKQSFERAKEVHRNAKKSI
jgi:hypothetical protein